MSERWDIAGTDNRILDQYRESPRLIALIKALVDVPFAELREVLESLLLRLDIDEMEGVQLDLIGTIVGRPRPDAFSPILVQDEDAIRFKEIADETDPEFTFDSLRDVGATTFTFIGLDGNGDPDAASVLARGFRSRTEPDAGGRFRSVLGVVMDVQEPRLEGAPFPGLDPNQFMSDPNYRRLLRATIYVNNSGATIPEIEFYGKFVLQSRVFVINNVGFFDLEFEEIQGRQAREIVDSTLLPAAGIQIRNKTYGLVPYLLTVDGDVVTDADGNALVGERPAGEEI